MEHDLSLRDVFPALPLEKDRLRRFLARHDLRYEEDIEYAATLVDGEENILASGCVSGNILKCFAVDERLRGQNIMGQLLSALVANRFQAGHSRLFVYTKPGNQQMFLNSGFYLLAQTEQVAMLENRADGLKRFLDAARRPAPAGARVGAAVMNCNPFTRGHRYLVEYAAGRVDLLYLFVVEENKSVFPFADRLRLVRAGTADLPQVRVCPGDAYMVSSATFPTYFLKQDDDSVLIQAELDAALFAQSIAPALNISCRFVGEEPYCAVTRKYNQALGRILPAHGVELAVIPRKQTAEGIVISASNVRAALIAEDYGKLRDLVPDTTYDYLLSEAAAPVLARLRTERPAT